MKKALIATLISLASCYICSAQLAAPVQSDTLMIKSMQYHFDEIRPENWPYTFIIRNADSFVFGDQEFKISSSEDRISFKFIYLESDKLPKLFLKLYDVGPNITIHFSDYIFVCEKPEASQSKITKGVRDVFSSLPPKDSIKQAIRETTESIRTKITGKPSAHVNGRNTVGNIPCPENTSQDNGIVVVDIWVDNYGTVQKAVTGADGTTTSSRTLWSAARKAAVETHFNMDSDAPALQKGTITYIFNAK